MHFLGVYLTSKCPQKGKKPEAFDNSGLRVAELFQLAKPNLLRV